MYFNPRNRMFLQTFLMLLNYAVHFFFFLNFAHTFKKYPFISGTGIMSLDIFIFIFLGLATDEKCNKN